MRLAAVAAVVAAVASAVACDAPREPDDRFAAYLGTDPDACGLDDVEPPPRALERATTTRQQVDALVPYVERLRRVRLEHDVEPRFVSPKALERRLERDLAQEWPKNEAESARRALVLLGAIPRRYDLRQAVIAASADVVGAYDTDDGELLVARTGSAKKLDAFDLETLAHELDHALVDQVHGIPDESQRDRWGDADAALAALVEGSAMLTELRFIRATEGEAALDALLDEPAELLFASEALPAYVGSALAFAYLEGVGFACRLYALGGWKRVDAAFDRPPRTTAEVLFPDRYLRRERPVVPPPLSPLPSPWRGARDAAGTFGAADLLFLFQSPGTSGKALDRPLERASAWNGGRIVLYRHGDESALAIAVVQRPATPSLCESLRTWYERAFPEARRGGSAYDGREQDAVIRCARRDVRIGIAPDLKLARRLVR